MENVNPYIPATKKDAEHLKRMRARVWPQFWLCVVILVAIITTCWIHFGWIQTLVGCIVVFVIGFGVLAGYGMKHACSEEEVRLCEEVLPGHDILSPEDIRLTGGQSFDFDCAPQDLYPYLAQMNLTKAGFYSFQVLERLFGFHIRNDYFVRPEWQPVQPGDWMYYHQNGMGTGVVDVKPNEYILTYSDTRFKPTQELAVAWRPKWMKGFAWTWNFILQPTNGGEGTHFISYLQAWWPEETSKLTIARLTLQWGLPSNFMMHKMASKMGKLACKRAQERRAGALR